MLIFSLTSVHTAGMKEETKIIETPEAAEEQKHSPQAALKKRLHVSNLVSMILYPHHFLLFIIIFLLHVLGIQQVKGSVKPMISHSLSIRNRVLLW